MKRALVATAAMSALVLVAGPAAANGPPRTIEFTDTFEAFNPCTGEPHMVTGNFTLREHAFDNEAGNRHHFNIQFFIDVVTDDGFSGKAVGPDIDNGAGLFEDEEGTGMFQSIINVNLSNDAGQRIKVHGNLHFNQVDGVPIAEVDNFSERCVGKPT